MKKFIRYYKKEKKKNKIRGKPPQKIKIKIKGTAEWLARFHSPREEEEEENVLPTFADRCAHIASSSLF
jgi:hypothetical protein